jgi:hypothetical protein
MSKNGEQNLSPLLREMGPLYILHLVLRLCHNTFSAAWSWKVDLLERNTERELHKRVGGRKISIQRSKEHRKQ